MSEEKALYDKNLRDEGAFAVDEAPEPELQTEPLLPLWLAVLLYGTFAAFALVAAIWIPARWRLQNRTFRYLEVIGGPWEEAPPAMDSEEMAAITEFLELNPRYSLLYLNQELLKKAIDDERIAKASALNKSLTWARDAMVRDMLDEVIENMESDGSMPHDYELPDIYREPLRELIALRRREMEDSYEAMRITDVLEWLKQGTPTPPLGPERRRLGALRESYNKRLFVGRERRVLRGIIRDWAEDDNTVKRSLAGKFQLMLEEEYVELTGEEQRLCEDTVDELEASFNLGRERLSKLSVRMVEMVEETGAFIDHPQIYEFCTLLREEHPPAAENIKEGLFKLRGRQFTLRFLDFTLRQDTVNPVLAVETERFTADEHRALLRHENTRRRRAAVEVVMRIAKDFYVNRFEIDGVETEAREEFVKRNTIAALGRVGEDPHIGEDAMRALETLRKHCPEWF